MSTIGTAPPLGEPPKAKGRLLSTMNEDGSRRWLRPWVSKGKFWNARRLLAYVLIAIFALVPHLSIFGKPVLLLDVQRKEFHFFGNTFLPSDTVLMALLMVSVFLIVFLVTALFGRVWCGWACPQTVYMEFLYRPIERFFDGDPAKKRRGGPANGVRRLLKYATFLACSLFLAHTFLAYFVPPAELITWVVRSPFEHPTAFLVMAITTGLMMFDFCFFREQVCLIACPYGRLQAAMLDRHSLIVSYDDRRGEPRGRIERRRPGDDVALPIAADQRGDCIDCHKCVTTCPTGIDIREGLQMECIGCAQCIDACDDVMDRIGKPRGLIRYSSQAIMAGEAKRIARPRVFVYPSVVAVLLVVFVLVLNTRASAEAQLLPRQGTSYYTLDDGSIANQTRVRVVNRSGAACAYTLSATDVDGIAIDLEENPFTLEPGESRIVGFAVITPPDAYGHRGNTQVHITVNGEDGYEKSLRYPIFGPTLDQLANSRSEAR